MVVMTMIGCKGRTYKNQVMLGNEPTNFYHWSWTAQDAPWGICDAEGNEIIPRVYPKSVKYYGDYFIADSIDYQVLYSTTGQRLDEAERIDRSGFRWFLIGTQNGSQYVYNLMEKSIIGLFNQVKVFACGGQVFFLDELEDGTKSISNPKLATVVRNADEVTAITDIVKNKKTGFFLARHGNLWEKIALDGKRLGKLTPAQVKAEQKKTANSRQVQEF